MQLSFDRKALHDALSLVKQVVPSRGTLPVLESIHIQPTSDGATLTATNLEQWLSVGIAATNGDATPEPLCIPPTPLLVLAGGKGESVSISRSVGKVRATLASGSTTIAAAVFDASDYPERGAGVDEVTTFTIPAQYLADGLARVLDHAQANDSRPALAGVTWKKGKGGTFKLLAADGFRLAVWSTACCATAEVEFLAILPLAGAKLLARILPKDDSVCTVSVGKSNLSVGWNRTAFSSQLVDATPPNFEQIIPTNQTTTLTCDWADLGGALSQAAATLRKSTDLLKLEIADGTVRAWANTADTEFSTTFPATIEGETVSQIGVNLTYLAQSLAAIPAGRVRIGLSGAARPLTVRPVEAAVAILSVLMPMSISK